MLAPHGGGEFALEPLGGRTGRQPAAAQAVDDFGDLGLANRRTEERHVHVRLM